MLSKTNSLLLLLREMLICVALYGALPPPPLRDHLLQTRTVVWVHRSLALGPVYIYTYGSVYIHICFSICTQVFQYRYTYVSVYTCVLQNMYTYVSVSHQMCWHILDMHSSLTPIPYSSVYIHIYFSIYTDVFQYTYTRVSVSYHMCLQALDRHSSLTPIPRTRLPARGKG